EIYQAYTGKRPWFTPPRRKWIVFTALILSTIWAAGSIVALLRMIFYGNLASTDIGAVGVSLQSVILLKHLIVKLVRESPATYDKSFSLEEGEILAVESSSSLPPPPRSSLRFTE